MTDSEDKLIQTPKLAGLVDDFIITRENINK